MCITCKRLDNLKIYFIRYFFCIKVQNNIRFFFNLYRSIYQLHYFYMSNIILTIINIYMTMGIKNLSRTVALDILCRIPNPKIISI